MNEKVEKQKNIYKHMSDKLPIGGVVRGSISDNGKAYPQVGINSTNFQSRTND